MIKLPATTIRGQANGQMVEIAVEEGDSIEDVVWKALDAMQRAGLSPETISGMLQEHIAKIEKEELVRRREGVS